MNQNKPTIREIKPEDKICFNCKYMLWAVALGYGVRCTHPDTYLLGDRPPMIPNRFHTCDLFEYKIELIEQV